MEGDDSQEMMGKKKQRMRSGFGLTFFNIKTPVGITEDKIIIVLWSKSDFTGMVISVIGTVVSEFVELEFGFVLF
jgi:hypothetical protein